MAEKRGPPENTGRKQRIAGMRTPEPCSASRAGEGSLCIAGALVGRNRFIAPISRAPPRTFRFRGKRRRGAAKKGDSPLRPDSTLSRLPQPVLEEKIVDSRELTLIVGHDRMAERQGLS